MLYLATPSSPATVDAMRAGRLGQLVSPGSNALLPGVAWAADNGCFTAAWDSGRWLRMLRRYADAPGCLFATVPDVVGDAVATDARWTRWAPTVRALGYVPAYVTQNGCQVIPVDAGAVFTGGDDAWKLSMSATALAVGAARRGLHTHLGRVNSRRRLRRAADAGYASCDGTFLAFGPDRNLPQLLAWLEPRGLWGVA